MLYIPKQYGVVEHKNWTLVIESANFMQTNIGLLFFFGGSNVFDLFCSK